LEAGIRLMERKHIKETAALTQRGQFLNEKLIMRAISCTNVSEKPIVILL
jgi:hypothetical protein